MTADYCDDGEERDFTLTWGLEPIVVMTTIFGTWPRVDIRVDGIEHKGLVLTDDEITDAMRDTLAKRVRAILKREEDEAMEEA